MRTSDHFFTTFDLGFKDETSDPCLIWKYSHEMHYYIRQGSDVSSLEPRLKVVTQVKRCQIGHQSVNMPIGDRTNVSWFQIGAIFDQSGTNR